MNKAKRKRCKNCNELFTPQYRTTQRACSMKCALNIAKENKKKQISDLEKLIKEDKETKSLSSEIAKTRTLVHKYVRLRDTGKPCISSGIPWQKDFEAGHCFSQKSYNALRFDLDNIHGQSINANRFKDGDEQNYLLNLPHRIGKERSEALKKREELSKRYTKQWTRTELKQIREEVKELMKKLNK
jgi:hypothetical protein